jgi:hypothetical protein
VLEHVLLLLQVDFGAPSRVGWTLLILTLWLILVALAVWAVIRYFTLREIRRREEEQRRRGGV